MALLATIFGCAQSTLPITPTLEATLQPSGAVSVSNTAAHGLARHVFGQPDGALPSSQPFVWCKVEDGVRFIGQAPFVPLPDPLPPTATCGPGRFGARWTVGLAPVPR